MQDPRGKSLSGSTHLTRRHSEWLWASHASGWVLCRCLFSQRKRLAPSSMPRRRWHRNGTEMAPKAAQNDDFEPLFRVRSTLRAWQEVKAEHSRFATAAESAAPVVVEPLVGEVKGIGGVIELLRRGHGGVDLAAQNGSKWLFGRLLGRRLRCQVRLFQGPAHTSHWPAAEVWLWLSVGR